MKIKDIMRTNVNLSESPGTRDDLLDENVDLFDLFDHFPLDRFRNYKVVDENRQKVGEINGATIGFLRQQFERLELSDFIQILENISEGVLIINREGYICFANPAYEKIIGVPMRKTLGRNMHDIEPEARILDTLESGREIICDDQLIQSVGKHVTMRIFPIKRGERVIGAFSIFRDLTKERRLSREVSRMTGLAEEYKNILDEHGVTQDLDIITTDANYLNVLKRAVIVARTDVSVLIRGENGTGKEVLANFIHKNSSRKDQPMITINCAAIPEELIESELFGYEEGTFTGAKKGGKIGRFELANGGTIFLDEIGDMPFPMQAKLLRVLQEHEIEKIGRNKSIPIDVRVIAATNQSLERMIEEKRFRQDLFFRLNVVSFSIPPLKSRKNDVISLSNYFLEKYNEKYGRDLGIETEVYQFLYDYPWPGNVRELQNTLESAVIMCQNENITLRDLPQYMTQGIELPTETLQTVHEGGIITVPGDFRNLKEEMDRYEKALIMAVIEECGGDKDKALERLGISKRSLYRKLSEDPENE